MNLNILVIYFNWLGRKDSNLRMTDPKSVALPLGDAPTPIHSTDLKGVVKSK